MPVLKTASLLAVFLLATSLAFNWSSPPRVILFIWDGAAQWIASRILAEGKLPHLQRMVREGAWSDGMVTSYPTKTAAALAVFWTGVYGHTNGITGNSVLLEPAAEHTRLEKESAFFSHPLRADPVWVMTARAGLMTYVFHATQSYPFADSRDRLRPEETENLRLLYGYSGQRINADILTERRITVAPAWGWTIAEAEGNEAREFSLRVGDRSFLGLFFDDSFDPATGCDTLGIIANKQAREFLARVKPGKGGSFSVPIATTLQGEELWFSLRVFELDETASRFLIYRSSAEAIFASSKAFPGLGETAIEAFAGNAGDRLYKTGRFGRTLMDGGDGSAEERLLATEAHLNEQIRRQTVRVLDEGDYRLLIMYSPVTDELTHAFVGYVDPSMPGFDPVVAEKVWPTLVSAFEIQDDLLGAIMDYASRDRAHVVLLADHGMAGTNRYFNVNVALAKAGLLALNSDRSIDLERTQALLLPTADTSIAVNTVDRKGGSVPLEEKPRVLARARKVLEAIEDPVTDERIVTAFFEPATQGLLQPGGSNTGDLFLDLARGYYFSDRTDKDEVVSPMTPAGNHIFVPTRRDMLAICAAWGPKVPWGSKWSRVRAIDIVPTVLDILELVIPAHLPGRSLLPEDSLVQ